MGASSATTRKKPLAELAGPVGKRADLTEKKNATQEQQRRLHMKTERKNIQAAIGVFAFAALLLAQTAVLAQHKGHDHAAEAKPAEQAVKQQTVCPVMGGKIDPKLYVEQDGKRIYLCCQGCVAPVKADFAKYEKQLAEQGIEVARVQETCPVMGKKIDKKLFVDQDGKRQYVCCRGCIAAVRKDFEKHAQTLREKGEYLEDTPKQ